MFTVTNYLFSHFYRQILARKWLSQIRNNLEDFVDVESQPVFIVGAGRTGSTLLARLIHERGGCHFGPENYTLNEFPKVFLAHQSKNWSTIIDEILKCFKNQNDFDRWKDVDLIRVKEAILKQSRISLGTIISEIYKNYGRSIGYPSDVWGCKTPALTPFAEIFKTIFPRSRFLVMQRPNSEVARSYKNTNIHPYCISPSVCYMHGWIYGKMLPFYNQSVRYSEIVDNTDNLLVNLYNKLELKVSEKPSPFNNPDTQYSHLSNVNSKICRTGLKK